MATKKLRVLGVSVVRGKQKGDTDCVPFYLAKYHGPVAP